MVSPCQSLGDISTTTEHPVRSDSNESAAIFYGVTTVAYHWSCHWRSCDSWLASIHSAFAWIRLRAKKTRLIPGGFFLADFVCQRGALGGDNLEGWPACNVCDRYAHGLVPCTRIHGACRGDAARGLGSSLAMANRGGDS